MEAAAEGERVPIDGNNSSGQPSNTAKTRTSDQGVIYTLAHANPKVNAKFASPSLYLKVTKGTGVCISDIFGSVCNISVSMN